RRAAGGSPHAGRGPPPASPQRAGGGGPLPRAPAAPSPGGAELRDDDLSTHQDALLMRVAAIDVGSNTVRLLVATLEDGVVKPIQEERTAVGLAREIERTGLIPDEKIARAAE